MNSYKRKKTLESALEEKRRKDKQERLWQIRQQWHIAQEREKQHEARKLKMIEEYERNRVQALKIHQKQNILQRSKSNSSQRRITDYKYPKEEKIKSALEEKERKDKLERLWQIRHKWYIAQERERQYKAQKSKMIEEYERNRAQALKIHQKQSVLQRSKSNSPQRRIIDYKYSEDSSPSGRAKKGKQDFGENKFSSRRNRSREPDDRVSLSDKLERLWQIRHKWYIAQERERQYKARKSKMIEEYERNRAQALKIHQKQSVLQRSKSNSPQRRITDYKYSEDSSPSGRAKKGKQDFGENKFSSRRNRSREPDDRVSLSQASSLYSFV